MIPIYKNTKIYVLCPPNVATGGPELLHQLVFYLINNLNLNAYMYYLPNNLSDPIHKEYKVYNNPFVRKIDDSKINLLIIPEVYDYIMLSKSYKHIRKALWWLSVDNFKISKLAKEQKIIYFLMFLIRVINKIFKISMGRPLIDLYLFTYKYCSKKSNENFKDDLRFIDYHLAQSHYAQNYLRNLGFKNVFFLSDFLNLEFLKEKFTYSQKEDLVVFNYQKTSRITYKLIKSAPDITFIAIKNMTRREVIETLKKAKVYIDFGPHPGKDRIPREAAVLGCCVITGKRGSAAYSEDIPIPEVYKFEDKKDNIPKIIEKIKDCLENYEERIKDFEYYREIIKKEPHKFISDLRKIFIKIENAENFTS